MYLFIFILNISFIVRILSRGFSNCFDKPYTFGGVFIVYDFFHINAMPPVVPEIEQVVKNILFRQINTAYVYF